MLRPEWLDPNDTVCSTNWWSNLSCTQRRLLLVIYDPSALDVHHQGWCYFYWLALVDIPLRGNEWSPPLWVLIRQINLTLVLLFQSLSNIFIVNIDVAQWTSLHHVLVSAFEPVVNALRVKYMAASWYLFYWSFSNKLLEAYHALRIFELVNSLIKLTLGNQFQ